MCIDETANTIPNAVYDRRVRYTPFAVVLTVQGVLWIVDDADLPVRHDGLPVSSPHVHR